MQLEKWRAVKTIIMIIFQEKIYSKEELGQLLLIDFNQNKNKVEPARTWKKDKPKLLI